MIGDKGPGEWFETKNLMTGIGGDMTPELMRDIVSETVWETAKTMPWYGNAYDRIHRSDQH